MINRDNYKDVKEYLNYLKEVKRNAAQTLKRRWAQLRHLLEWSDETPLPKAHTIRPTLPAYLEAARNDGSDKPLAPSTVGATCGAARAFFRWAKRKYPRRYRQITDDWIETLRVPKATGDVKERELFTIDEVRLLTKLPVDTLTEQRDQAAIAFLFLSGARVGAFVSLPIHAIDLENRKVRQLPSIGVKTKNRRKAITHLLDIPDLLEVVARWDRLVRAKLPPDALWYATLTTDGMNFTGSTKAGEGRESAVARGIRQLCVRAGIPYHSPHKLRHGHAVYAIKHAKDMADLKAISQNLMHASLMTTEGIYGGLPDDDVGARIAGLTHFEQPTFDNAAIDALADAIVRRLPDRSDALADALVNAMMERLLAQMEGAP